MKGGYQMVDCKGLDLTGGSTAQTIAGIHEEFSKALASNKPVYLYGCKNGTNKPTTPIQAFLNAGATGTIVATIAGAKLFVSSENAVVIE